MTAHTAPSAETNPQAPDDVPHALRRHARVVSWVSVSIVLLTVAEQVWEVVAEEGAGPSPWLGITLGFWSAAAIGLDALVVGVRKKRDFGPSIANLGPGGWACFAALMWILAVPAYFLGAPRPARRGGDDDPREPASMLTLFAIALVVLVGAAAARGIVGR
jgi:hypothetical protein